jgi:hypothetical protein
MLLELFCKELARLGHINHAARQCRVTLLSRLLPEYIEPLSVHEGNRWHED